MILPIPLPRTHALDTLEPILNDPAYFRPTDYYSVKPSMLLHIERAVIEIEAQLAAVSEERLQQIISRLMLHFPLSNAGNRHHISNDYFEMLFEYPEDLLCAAYQHVLKHHKCDFLPRIADLVAFMEPEMMRRKSVERRLEILLQRIEAEVDA